MTPGRGILFPGGMGGFLRIQKVRRQNEDGGRWIALVSRDGMRGGRPLLPVIKGVSRPAIRSYSRTPAAFFIPGAAVSDQRLGTPTATNSKG